MPLRMTFRTSKNGGGESKIIDSGMNYPPEMNKEAVPAKFVIEVYSTSPNMSHVVIIEHIDCSVNDHGGLEDTRNDSECTEIL
jgi:hypothetical protein